MYDRVELVIGHAGAGTIMEVLRRHKKLVVVVNETLMNNHQHEIADALAEKNYVIKSTCDSVVHDLSYLPRIVLTPYPKRDVTAFSSFMDREFHFAE